jgi:hypothetical protein
MRSAGIHTLAAYPTILYTMHKKRRRFARASKGLLFRIHHNRLRRACADSGERSQDGSEILLSSHRFYNKLVQLLAYV